MGCNCRRCFQSVSNGTDVKGLQYCTNCRTLFLAAVPHGVPLRIFGVLAILTAHRWQIVCHR
jgi:hypothetical protein